MSCHKTLWKVREIQEVTKVKDGIWQVKMSYYNYSNVNKCFQDRTRDISFKLRERDYEHFEQLISCMEYVGGK